ncbi:hypothetical protein OE88DRAFT_1726673 [Heliocybe sulcata]|uniref:Uncharacterized protein n=1 Tax=Heliocybe sulcata TaxID=5364 RepID=A0A5C3N8L2_9AGAM|nr:hypothetical protein OE88DRAFT_1726673 [Heliocybe sulcata]
MKVHGSTEEKVEASGSYLHGCALLELGPTRHTERAAGDRLSRVFYLGHEKAGCLQSRQHRVQEGSYQVLSSLEPLLVDLAGPGSAAGAVIATGKPRSTCDAGSASLAAQGGPPNWRILMLGIPPLLIVTNLGVANTHTSVDGGLVKAVDPL